MLVELEPVRVEPTYQVTHLTNAVGERQLFPTSAFPATLARVWDR